jgi:hypothetical protein
MKKNTLVYLKGYKFAILLKLVLRYDVCKDEFT